MFNRNNPEIVPENGCEVPETPGVTLTQVMTKNLSGPGTIEHVVNGVGDAVASSTGGSEATRCAPAPAEQLLEFGAREVGHK